MKTKHYHLITFPFFLFITFLFFLLISVTSFQLGKLTAFNMFIEMLEEEQLVTNDEISLESLRLTVDSYI